MWSLSSTYVKPRTLKGLSQAENESLGFLIRFACFSLDFSLAITPSPRAQGVRLSPNKLLATRFNHQRQRNSKDMGED